MSKKLPVADYEAGKKWLREVAPAFADKVAPLFDQLRWTWVRGEKDRYIPNRDQILQNILGSIDALDTAALERNPDGTSASSGGLRVGVWRDGGTSYEARIDFTVSESLFESLSEDWDYD